jgi:hypothetical protein
MTSALMDAVAPKTWNGIYPGRVVSDADPDKRGRVRVRCEQVYGDPLTEDEFIPDNALPWARVSCQVSGRGTGMEWTPPENAAVLVAFWGGDGERPIVIAAWHPALDPDGDNRIPEHVSSYVTGPKTRVVRTEGDQVFEMRWKPGEEKVRLRLASGAELVFIDSPAEQGIYIEITTPLGYRMRLDEKQTSALIETPTRHVKLDDAAMAIDIATPTQSVHIDDVAQTISILTPGNILATAGGNVAATAGGTASVTAAGIVTIAGSAVVQASTSPGGTATTTAAGLSISTFTGFALQTFLGALTMAITGAWILTATGIATINAVGILSLFGSQVVLGTLLATKYRLLDERAIAIYNGHSHPGVTPGGSSTGGPSALMAVGAHTTTDTTAS